MPVTINNKNISASTVAAAAQSGGVSKAELAKMAAELQKLAEQMNFGDGQALQQLATLIGDAAGAAGGSTGQTGGGGFNPNAGGTAPPGT